MDGVGEKAGTGNTVQGMRRCGSQTRVLYIDGTLSFFSLTEGLTFADNKAEPSTAR